MILRPTGDITDNYPPPPGGPPPPADIGRLLLRCHDHPGIIAAVSTFLARAGANIISLDQHSTAPEGEHSCIARSFNRRLSSSGDPARYHMLPVIL